MNRNPYVRPISAREWVFRHPRYVRYMVREFSCLFIAGWTLLLVWGLRELADGPDAWAGYLELLKSPASVAFQVLTLAFAAYHSITWFNLTPKALPVQMGEGFVPGWVIAGAHYAGWVVVTAGLLYAAGVF